MKKHAARDEAQATLFASAEEQACDCCIAAAHRAENRCQQPEGEAEAYVPTDTDLPEFFFSAGADASPRERH